ncbi:MAG: HAD hydrolase-like protein [Bdellovibrionales bacterium]|nr:HAD hydrolase-like protein [Bdellovibrionales bacterium]
MESPARPYPQAAQPILSGEIRPAYILVDFFDTIIRRTVHPEYVKRLWAKRLRQRLGLNESPEMLYERRRRLEAQLCEANRAHGDDDEFRYRDMCDALLSELRREGAISLSLSEASFAALAEQIEFAVETAVQEVIPEIREQLFALRHRGYPLVLVSDSYLSEGFFRDLLYHHRLHGLFERVFVSNTFLRAKRSGRLFDVVRERLGVEPDQLVMLGDNPHSDGLMAVERGIRPLRIDATGQHQRYQRLLASAAQRANAQRKLESYLRVNLSRAELFPEFPLAIYNFIHRLYHRLQQESVQDAFFFSREGYLLKQLFDIYQQELGGGRGIRSHYLKVSRRSTFMPSLSELDAECFETLFRQYREISLREFLLNLSFSEEQIRELGGRLSIDLNCREDDFPTSGSFQRLREDDLFRDWYEEKRQAQRSAFRSYLGTFGVDFEADGFVFVDIGWKGTIQDNLRRFFDDSVQLTGYYLGLAHAINITPSNRKEGLLFSVFPWLSEYYFVYAENPALFEVLLGAPHGSAHSYAELDGVAIAQTDENAAENRLYEQVIRPLQQGYLETFRKLCRVLLETHFDTADFEELFAKRHARIVYFPSVKELAFFQNVQHFENFGLFEFTTFEPEPVSNRERLKNLVALMKSPMETIKSNLWSSVSFYRLGLSWLRYPYGAVMFYRVFYREKHPLLKRLDSGFAQSMRAVSSLARRGRATS